MILWKNVLNSLCVYHDIDTMPHIFLTVLLYALFIIFNKMLSSLNIIVQYRYTDEVIFYIDNILVEKIAQVDLQYFDSSESKDEIAFVEANISSSIQSTANYIIQFIQVIISVCISSYIVIAWSPLFLPLILLIIIPEIFAKKYSNNIRYLFEKKHIVKSRKIGYYAGVFSGNALNEIKLYNLFDFFKNKYINVWNDIRCAKDKINKKEFFIMCSAYLFSVLSDVLALVYCIFQNIESRIFIGDVSYYVSIFTKCREDILNIFNLIINFDDESIRLSDVKNFMERDNMFSVSGNLTPSSNPVIEFRNVSFRYPNVKRNVLSNCSFKLNPGEIVGLVGLNGSGKSTIVKLMCRFYDPTEGEILIDGIDAKEYNIIKLRSLFSVLFQDYVKYSCSLRENIALSDISRLDCDNDIIEATQKSCVSDFTYNWEKGLDENLTRMFDPEGKELSGGQWQRLALARAFFRNAPIVMLDEPSAALDSVAEHKIFEDFTNLSKGKSAILISHRLSSITLCDKILVLSEGHITEQGTHKDLLEKNGEYARLFNLQANKYV